MTEPDAVVPVDVLEDHIVLFLDLLGFSEASVQENSGRQEAILRLLRDIAGLRGEFVFRYEKTDSGFITSFRPTVSTFSDNIVLSVPIGGIVGEGIDEKSRLLHAIPTLAQLTSAIAARAFDIGLLIRGGMTIGKLFHANGVVFGGGLVEAYQLESRTANYPRVVVSSKIVRRVPADVLTPWVTQDIDGISIVDYHREILTIGLPRGADFRERFGAAWRRYEAIIDKRIEDLTSAERLAERAKWIWFVRRLASALPPEIQRAYGLSLDGVNKHLA